MRPKPRITKYIGLSTDTKPSADYGDTFLEMDTGTVCMFDGETWHARSREREYSGDIVSFKARKVVPMQSVVVSMEPVQDLHGYDHPWPAGGGKNKLDIAKLTNYTNPGNGSTLVNNGDGSITVTATSSTNIECGKTLGEIADLVVGHSYIITADSTGSTKYVYLHGGGSTWTFGYEKEITQDILDGKVSFYASGTQSSATISNLMIRPASVSDATYAPYSNECPISGRTGADIEHTGVNVWDEEWELGTINDSTGLNAPETTIIRSKNYIPVVGNTAYYFKTANANMRVFKYRSDKSYIGYDNVYNSVLTLGEDVCFIRYRMYVAYGTTYNHDISINYPATDTEYHAYQGETISVSWESEAGTVYGGTLDVVTGELVVDRAMVDLGTLTFTKNDSSFIGLPCFYATIPNAKAGVPYVACSDYTIKRDRTFIDGTGQISPGNGSDATYCVVRDDRYATVDAAEFKAAMSGVQLVYEIVEPITYHLTPQEVRTLLGDNNVWSDAGDVTVKVKL